METLLDAVYKVYLPFVRKVMETFCMRRRSSATTISVELTGFQLM